MTHEQYLAALRRSCIDGTEIRAKHLLATGPPSRLRLTQPDENANGGDAETPPPLTERPSPARPRLSVLPNPEASQQRKPR